MHNRFFLKFLNISSEINSLAAWNDLFYCLLDANESREFRNMKYKLSVLYRVEPTPEQHWDDLSKTICLEWRGENVKEFGSDFLSSKIFQTLIGRANISGWKIIDVDYVIDDEALLKEEKFIDFSDVLQIGTPGVHNFYSSDTEESFKKASKDKNWFEKYKNKIIKYTINSHGYRGKEFEDIDWKKNICVFGCSNSFGVGIDDSETLDSLITNYSGRDTINLSVPGSSIDFALHNSMVFKEKFGNPKAVIFVWTHHMRTIQYLETLNHIGAWKNDRDVELISHHNHRKSMAIINYMMAKEIWKDIPQFHCTFFPDVSFLLDIPLLFKLDFARDGLHPGPESTEESAKFIWKNVKNII